MKKYFLISFITQLIIIGLLLPYNNIWKNILAYWTQYSGFVTSLAGPIVAGIVIWLLGVWVADKKIKQDAIRDLMTYRDADFTSTYFRQSLNKIAIVFHNDSEIRQEVKHLYEILNTPTSPGRISQRTIVGLIYKLCHKNGFSGLTEYDIDQSFILPSQDPAQAGQTPEVTSTPPKQSKKRSKKRDKKR